jgi:hypothetical protein
MKKLFVMCQDAAYPSCVTARSLAPFLLLRAPPFPDWCTHRHTRFLSSKSSHCTLINQNRARTLCRGGFIICLMKRMVASSRHITPRHLKLLYTAVAKRACDLQFVDQMIEAQTRNTHRRLMARLAIGSEYTQAFFSLFYHKFDCDSARRRFLQRSSWMLQERADKPFTMVRL